MGIGQEIYTGAAAFGRVIAIFSAVTITLISLVLIGIGIYIIVKFHDFKPVTAKITGENCTVHNCLYDITYTVNGRVYNTSIHNNHQKENTMQIYYNPKNPREISTKKSGKMIGIFLICLGIILPMISWFWVWIVRKYKIAAAAETVMWI